MMVEVIKADLFSMKVDALAHGVNCEGKMGKGIALEFKRRFPSNYKHYVRQCMGWQDGSSMLNTGSLMWWWGQIHIFNLATQEATGKCAQYGYLMSAMDEMRELISDNNQFGATSPIKSIAMPWIGCGIGGLHKDGVESIVRHVFDDWQGTVYICDLEEQYKDWWQAKQRIENNVF